MFLVLIELICYILVVGILVYYLIKENIEVCFLKCIVCYDMGLVV